MGDVNPLRRLGSRRASDEAAAADPRPTDVVTVWLRAAGRGDQRAFAQVYDELAGLVHGISLKVLRDPARAEEVTQEVFLEVWRLAPRFDPNRGSARSWVATIAHRRAVDTVRSTQSSRDREEREARQAVVSAPSADEPVLGDLQAERVRQSLGRLTELQRQAVELAYYGGHTYREVAVLLDIPEGTVKTRIRDGLIRLRDELGATP